jgi:molybdate transport system substrate-binding protein
VPKLKVMCARSMHVAVGELARGHPCDFDFGTVGGLQAKLDAGATADVVILSVPAIAKLEKAGALLAGSRVNVARTSIGVAVRVGAPAPDISTAETFRQALDNARTIAFSDPSVGGSAGVYLAGMFEGMGLAVAVQAKGLPQKTGAEVARRVAEGKADFGLTLMGEIAPVPGVWIAGPLPPPLGQDTTYCGAVMAGSAAPAAGKALIAALTAAEARATWKRYGFDLA